MRKVLVNSCRLVLALTFILSGFVKAVDPLGTQYKLNDYLEAMHLDAMVPDLATLGGSVLLAAMEFCLGVFLLFAIHRRLVSRLLVLVMGIMTALTVWIYIADPVSDCGCFGDAIVLTNGQTLLKNIILLAAAIVVALWPLDMMRFISKTNQWIVINYTAVFILIIEGYALYDLPQFDFRPYHVGANIMKGMEIPEGAEQPEFETTFIMEKNGERREFGLDNYPDSTWTYIDTKTIQTKQGYVPPIHDFSMTSLDGEDLTEEILTNQGYTFLLVSPHLEDADDSQLDLINQVYEYAEDNGYPFYCLTASGEQGINRWRDITGAEYPYCLTDETTLKTVIRSNPGMLLLKDGTIIRKWSHNRLPDEYALDKPLEQSELGQMPEDSVPKKIITILLWYVLPLLMLTIADRLWAWSRRTKNNDKSNNVHNILKRKNMRKKIVAGNWKMNMNLQDGIALAKELNETLKAEKPNCGVVICTPFIHLASIAQFLDQDIIGL
ncbi:MAG: triose-phosphate isomerase, partial [Prevotella sp.]|nr:triose-phosphate isomerase [Prevotella sp.]